MGLDGTYTIGRIVIHPTNPDIVYVAATGHEWTYQSRPRRLQDDRRRDHLAEGPLRQRKGRGERPRHGPPVARHPLRLDLEPHPPALERPGPRRRGRPVQDDRRRQDLEAHQQRPPRHELHRAASASTSAGRSRDPLRLRRQPHAGRRAEARREGFLRPAAPAGHRRRRGLSLRRRRRELAQGQPAGRWSASAAPTAGSSARSASTPIRPRRSTSWASACRNRPTAARPIRASITPGSTATTTACGSIPTTATTSSTSTTAASTSPTTAARPGGTSTTASRPSSSTTSPSTFSTPFCAYGSVQDQGTYRGQIPLRKPGPGAPARAAAASPCPSRSGRRRRAARGRSSPSIRPIPTRNTPRPSTAGSSAPSTRTASGRARRSTPRPPRASPPTAASGWRRRCSRPTILRSSITASSISSGP